jgi:hypothetical protein
MIITFIFFILVWLDVMVPVMDMKNYTSFVVGYLKDILTHSPHGRPVNHEQFFAVLSVIHSPTCSLPNNVRQELLSLIPSLRVCTCLISFQKRCYIAT